MQAARAGDDQLKLAVMRGFPWPSVQHERTAQLTGREADCIHLFVERGEPENYVVQLESSAQVEKMLAAIQTCMRTAT